MTHFGGRKKGVFLYQNLLLHNCFQISVVLIIQIFNKKKDFLSKIHRTLDQKKIIKQFAQMNTRLMIRHIVYSTIEL